MYIETEKTTTHWKQYTLANDNGMQVSVLNYGGIISKILVPDRLGKLENVVLGYKNIQDYEDNPNCFGAIIGRVAGRIANSSFQLDLQPYKLDENEGKHHLHGGSSGFHQVIWDVEPFQTADSVGLRLSHKSPDGASGYPGELHATVTYILTNENQLKIEYDAISDKKTPIALTNHSYFNLSGNLKDTIHQHHVTIDSDQFIELDNELIPTGSQLKVDDTTFDFRNGRKLKDGLNGEYKHNEIVGNGYDHYFVFNQKKTDNVIVTEETSGRTLHISTNQPGMVMYTANSLNEGLELAEGESKQYLGVCFETQGSPASLHHEEIPSIVVEENQAYKKQTIFTFGVKN
ncbi:galactose-1-epimerase [Ornithinibacillus sp. L9]|uniref:Aldose 1-epimerase n=1 Tax=Ornithinibacillus caprae TaxID=2678566 RepID=A0A6N8FNV9_9BACI|nr:aldose epimerase family protein [Ornithinibacillus caprae]MUK90214.1 galactose-1-epimerase [Ornithinibacillus caprae]